MARRILRSWRPDQWRNIDRVEIGYDKNKLQPGEIYIRLDGSLLEQFGLQSTKY